MIIYYERYVIQAGIAVNGEGESVKRLDFNRRRIFEYIRYASCNQYLDDFDPNKCCQNGSRVYHGFTRIDLDELSYQLRHNANTETSKQRKTEALKDYKLLNPSVSLT
jgi:DNA-directed RNA polymerase subunit beta'